MMKNLSEREGALHLESTNLAQVAQQYGTPCYVYSRNTIEDNWDAFDKAFANHPHLVCYAVKANSSLSILNLLAKKGSGFDIVSGGELERVLRAGGKPENVVFSGVGKTADEIRLALEKGIRCFNVESESELEHINDIALGVGKVAPVSLRINPDVDAKTHPYIATGLKENKFGIAFERAKEVYLKASSMKGVRIEGIDAHIGSQLTSTQPFVDALNRVLQLINELESQGITIHHIDMGGGLGICYENEKPPSPSDYAQALLDKLGTTNKEILIEPGRAIVGNAGVLLTRVEYLKHNEDKNFAIVDAAMNDLMRPTLYDAWHAITPVTTRKSKTQTYDIVGPVCETGDWLGKNRQLNLEEGDVLAIENVGAYGFTMSSNYNTRPRCAEILIDGDRTHVIRERERLDDLLKGETILSD